ncbi:MAG TPA: flagellar basal body rod protein FlgB [Candidatus Cloacimonadota bacterium]|jgi:flagellar basal-body rod protein FlgB|nr:flagellar basal body rod protein FlgB [Candidatus Cloacimonadota bacterium]
MITDLLFDRTACPDLEQSMNVYSLRHKTLSNNIANAMTPRYKAQKVDFEEEYKKALSSSHIKGYQTNSEHMDLGRKSLTSVDPVVSLRNNPVNDTGLNNVDIDKEMAEMAENNLRYEMSTKLVMKRYANIKSAIRGR